MKLIDTMKELGCDYYYIIELCDDEDIDDCLEYYTAADDVNEDLFDCEVLDYDHISKEFAVIYLNTDSLNEEEECDGDCENCPYNEEDVDDYIFQKNVDLLIEAFRNLVEDLDDPVSIAFASDPDAEVFAVNVGNRTVIIPYEDEER